MTVYKYRAKNGPENITEGKIDAVSEKEALDKLINLGLVPLSIEQGKMPAGPSLTASCIRLSGKVRAREVTLFSRQLASLLKSGVTILNSLNIISEQSENRNLKGMLQSIHGAVKDGATFSAGLAQYPEVFPALFIAMIRAGENSGVLPDALLRIADYRSKQEDLLSRFRMALAYPALMAVVGVGTIIFMFTFAIPRLTLIFTELGQDLPLPTRILISLSQIFRQWWLWAVLILLILIIRKQWKAKSARAFWSRYSLRMPVFGKLLLKSELGRFTRTLELLIKNGIPILKGIDIAIPVVGNEVISKQLKLSYKELEQGGSFGGSLKNSKIIPLFMCNMIIVAEESGKLAETLGEIASYYEQDTDEAIKIMTSLLEPLMILTMGLIVGFIVVSMLLPVFEINVMLK